jgi:hypothetical protein
VLYCIYGIVLYGEMLCCAVVLSEAMVMYSSLFGEAGRTDPFRSVSSKWRMNCAVQLPVEAKAKYEQQWCRQWSWIN